MLGPFIGAALIVVNWLVLGLVVAQARLSAGQLPAGSGQE